MSAGMLIYYTPILQYRSNESVAISPVTAAGMSIQEAEEDIAAHTKCEPELFPSKYWTGQQRLNQSAQVIPIGSPDKQRSGLLQHNEIFGGISIQVAARTRNSWFTSC
jgi:hypothetical protein